MPERVAKLDGLCLFWHTRFVFGFRHQVVIEGALRNKSANEGALLVPIPRYNQWYINNTYRETELPNMKRKISFRECSENLLVAMKLHFPVYRKGWLGHYFG